MKFEDWHTHNKMCHHAVGTIEDYIKRAIQLRLRTIGISDHFPYDYLKNIERIPYNEYAISIPEIDNYLTITEKLKTKFEKEIIVRIGFEIDYLKNQEPLLNNHLNQVKKKLDYILASIHILNFFDGRGAWGFDDSRFRTDYEHYGVDKVHMFYYKSLQKLNSSKEFDFDIIAHFDLPKKFNDIPENRDIVYNEAMKTLELIKKRDVVVEINTSGLRKGCKEQYPSNQIIQEMNSLDIPILLGSDAHKPSDVAWKFKEMVKMLKNIGYTQLAHFKGRKREFIEI
ncbi:MAG: histidinol-phosphatase HisJ [Promethearchaeota archaeon]|jgi:histidinol-phosphatase (PHP family)